MQEDILKETENKKKAFTTARMVVSGLVSTGNTDQKYTRELVLMLSEKYKLSVEESVKVLHDAVDSFYKDR